MIWYWVVQLRLENKFSAPLPSSPYAIICPPGMRVDACHQQHIHEATSDPHSRFVVASLFGEAKRQVVAGLVHDN